MATRKQPSSADQLRDLLLAEAAPRIAFSKDGLLDELKRHRPNKRRTLRLIIVSTKAKWPIAGSRGSGLFSSADFEGPSGIPGGENV